MTTSSNYEDDHDNDKTIDEDLAGKSYGPAGISSDDKDTKERISISELTHAIMQIATFKTLRDTREIYYYDERIGVFISDGESIIQMHAEMVYPDISTHEVTEVTNHIIRRTLTDRQEFDKRIEWIACKNCMVNLRTLETKPHSPDFMATMQIPIKYEPSSFITDFFEWVEGGGGISSSCPCPTIMKFMHQVMAPEDVETVLDFIVYCLWRAFPFHRYLLFNGSGRNGKGVMLEVVKRLLGSQNISGESLHRLLENRFATAELYGKLANIDADLSREALYNTGILKKLTGGDYIPAEKKFMRPFRFVNYAKLLFSANEIPLTPDESDAFFARLIIINFPNQFLGDKADPYLIDKLTTDSELSGLLGMAVKRIPKVLAKGIYVPTSSIGENYTKYIQSSNPVRAFVETAIVQDRTISMSIPKEDVYDAYKRFCNDKKLACESEQSFSRKLTKEYGFESYQMRDDRKPSGRSYYWKYIELVDWTKVKEDGQTTFTV